MEKFYNDVLPLIDSAVEKIESKRRSDTLVFPLFTDLHTMDAEHEYSKKLIFVLEKLCSKTSVEGVVNLGDTFNMLGRMIQIPNGELEIRFNELFSKIHTATGVPLINVNGNHDAIGTDFFKSDFWNGIVKGKFGNDRAVYSNDGSYYYLDFDTARLVVLSLPHDSDLESEHPTPAWSFGEKQLDWLENPALATEKNVIILSHVPLFYSVYYGDPEAMLGVWNGKERKTSYVSALCGWIDDIDRASEIITSFSKKGKLVGVFSGHTHFDSLWEPFETQGKYTNPVSCKQAVTGAAFINAEFMKLDVMVFTPSENKLTLVRIGDGEDREI